MDGHVGLAKVLAHGEEPELALRGDVMLAPRLVRTQHDRLEFPQEGSWRIGILQKGQLDALSVETIEAAPLEAGQVRIQIEATGVNFRDVLNVLGMVETPWLGLELAGIVSEVADDVTTLAVGDRVLGLADSTFASTTTADARYLVRIPDGMRFQDAATIPLVFLTAYYALFDLGDLKADEKVLIHAAAGGVGMAAVQLAIWKGAEIYATASEPKWEIAEHGIG